MVKAAVEKPPSAFDETIKRLKAEGRIIVIEDAVRKFRFLVTDHHVRIAKRGDESECVLAQSFKDAVPVDCVVSIGETVAKVLYVDSAKVFRYRVPPKLKEALDHFDTTGQWDLEPGMYHLGVPDESTKLTKNRSEEKRKLAAKRWKKFHIRLKKGKTNGNGINHHRSRPITSRQITVIGKGRKQKIN